MTVTINGTTGIDTIQDGIVSTAKIATSAVSTAKIAADAVTTAKIAGDAVTADHLNFGQIGGRRNWLINSEFEVNQRGVTSTTTTGSAAYTADRWKSYSSGGTVTITIQSATLTDGTICKSHKTELTSGPSSWLHPFQTVEIQEWMKGQTIVLSAWVKTNMSNQKIRICDSTQCVLIGDEISNDGAWHYIYATHTLPTNISTSGFMQFHPAFTEGSQSYSTGSYIEFALPQMEIGTYPTAHEFRTYGDELLLCQRYYQRQFPPTGNGVTNGTSGFGRVKCPIVPSMRTSPSVSRTGNMYMYDGTGTFLVSSTGSVWSTPHVYEFDGVLNQNHNGAGRPAIPYNDTSPGSTLSNHGFILDAEL